MKQRNRPMSSRSSSPLALFGACALIALAGCESSEPNPEPAPPPSRVELSEEFTAAASVTAVDRENRAVTLRRADGALLELVVGPAARNFDQIAVGDEVRVRYKTSLVASHAPAGAKVQAAEAVAAAARSTAGDKPGAGMGVAASARVKVESLDLSRDIVVLSLASGELVSHRLATPQGRAFAKGLEVGDVVQLDYAEALALSVEEI